MAISVLVSTTGAGTFTFADLGAKSLTHPIVDEEFIGQFTASELSESLDLQAALDATDITVKLDGTLITDLRLIAEGIQDASQVPFNNGSSGLTATDAQAAIDEVEGRVDTLENSGVASDTFCLSASRNANKATNVYLRMADGLPTNETPFILPYNCTLTNLTAANNGAETWIGEVRIGGTLVTGAFITITAATSGTAVVDVDFNAGDAIQLFCNGTDVKDPMLNLFFERR